MEAEAETWVKERLAIQALGKLQELDIQLELELALELELELELD